MKLTHINSNKNPTMVDVSTKNITHRTAIARGEISMTKKAYTALINNSGTKGPVIDTAVIAAIMGAKKTSELIPMCHPLLLGKIDCNVIKISKTCTIALEVSVQCDGKTGVEMEALTGVSLGLLTIYDMLKAIDKTMILSNITLSHKSGGKSGDYERKIK